MPHLLILLINEAFETNYSEDAAVKQLRNEHFERNVEIITDAFIEIEYHTYHIECQRDEYTDLYNLAMKIIRHVVKSEAVKRRFVSMGGKVLTLESERIRAEGRAEGLINGGNLMVYALVQDGDISPERGAQRLNVTVEELQSRMILTGCKWPEKQ